MEAHGVREGDAENLVVGGSNALQNIAQMPAIFRSEVVHTTHMATTANQNFERPNRPEGHERTEDIGCVPSNMRAASTVPSPALRESTPSPKSGNADADCWRPSWRRDFRKSVRG